ncbi:hypothetical protein ABAC402_04200 [Asticcacaulis sp. AC402]|nr:hypothetical protein ABAC402_04200 [Asticcacaulis sp. AC402]
MVYARFAASASAVTREAHLTMRAICPTMRVLRNHAFALRLKDNEGAWRGRKPKSSCLFVMFVVKDLYFGLRQAEQSPLRLMSSSTARYAS